MDNIQQNIINLLREATGTSDVGNIDYKDIKGIKKHRIDTAKVRGSVRLMSGKIKTTDDVEAMKKAFISLHIP